MGDVNLEIKLNNIDERLIKVEENGGSGDSYIESVSSDFKVVNKKLSLADIIKTAITSISNKLNKPESANDGDALVYDSDSNEWLPKQIESENYINDVSNDFNVIDKLLSLKDDIKNKINSIGDISLLGTVDKTDIVSAINSLTVGGVNNGIYTGDEIIIGQWLGKPLYRKILTVAGDISVKATTWTTIITDDNLSNIELIRADIVRVTDNTIIKTPSSRIYNNSFQIYNMAVLNIPANTKIIIEYTKSTD